MKVAFLVPSLTFSGGVNVIVEHASRLAAMSDFEVTVILTEDDLQPARMRQRLDGADIISLKDAGGLSFDIAIATWWKTVPDLLRLSASQSAYFVQSLEDRFYRPGSEGAVVAGLTYELGIPVITEAHWISELFRTVRPNTPCYYVRNGINKTYFPVASEVTANEDGPLRVLIEGDPTHPLKAVPDALEAARMMKQPAQVTLVSNGDVGHGLDVDVLGPLTQVELSEVYAQNDVLLKLSTVEGMAGPPLEAFHRGATCVTSEVTGNDEYVRHGWNGLVTAWDDPHGTARTLDLLAKDRRLLTYLQTNALATAADWPTWEESSAEFAHALRDLATQPAFSASAVRPLMMAATDNAYRYTHERDVAVHNRNLAHIALNELRIELRKLQKSRAIQTIDRVDLLMRGARRSARLGARISRIQKKTDPNWNAPK
jgi:glycosyltransferase involved in cell wall biosynthesis